MGFDCCFNRFDSLIEIFDYSIEYEGCLVAADLLRIEVALIENVLRLFGFCSLFSSYSIFFKGGSMNDWPSFGWTIERFVGENGVLNVLLNGLVSASDFRLCGC